MLFQMLFTVAWSTLLCAGKTVSVRKLCGESDFSDTAYNLQTLVMYRVWSQKLLYKQFSAKIFWHKIEVLGKIWDEQKEVFSKIMQVSAVCLRTAVHVRTGVFIRFKSIRIDSLWRLIKSIHSIWIVSEVLR